MDLWIKSQDKRGLYKPQYIELYGENEVHFGDINIGYRCVATYQTKERALEVLDEIQEILNPDIPPLVGKCEFIQLNNYVYEMPKE